MDRRPDRTEVVFVGPLPPPVEGMAAITRRMLDLLSVRTRPFVLNRARETKPDGSRVGRLRSALRLPRQVVQLAAVLLVRRPRSLYLAFSSGFGQLQDLALALLARAFRLRIFVHHHNFNYLDQPNWCSRLSIGLLPAATHIVLGETMAARLVASHGVARHRVRVISNCAFEDAASPPASAPRTSTICVGFLSNITTDKGIFEFFAAVDAIRAAGIDCEALVAGPVATDILDRFRAEVAGRPFVRWLGPVYGPAKADFWSRIDLFIFPTRYANEAEPLVILEAMRSGVEVLASTRGCIHEMLMAYPAGRAVAVERIADEAVLLAAGVAAGRERRVERQARYQATCALQRNRLAVVLGELIGSDAPQVVSIDRAQQARATSAPTPT